MSSICSPLLVLAGEVGVVRSADSSFTPLQTSCLLSSVALTLYDCEKKIAVLAHIDDFTSVKATINKIQQLLQEKYQATLSAETCKATYLGGMRKEEGVFSRKHKGEIREALDALHIPSTEILLCEELDDRPQVTLNPETGELKLLEMRERNTRIELLQMYEYSLFRAALKADFPDYLKQIDRKPYFEAKEAERTESDLPPIELDDAPTMWEARVRQVISDDDARRMLDQLIRPDRKILK